jgi:hypothetical protein
MAIISIFFLSSNLMIFENMIILEHQFNRML